MINTFEQFFYKTLLESPRNTGEFVSEYSDTPIAMAKYDDIMRDDSIRVVYALYPDSHSVYLYEDFNLNKSAIIIDDVNQIDTFYGDAFMYEKYRITISKNE